MAVTIAVYHEEVGDRHVVARSMDGPDFRVAAVEILASIPQKTLEAIVGGNLCHASRQEPEIQYQLTDGTSPWSM
ncbi:hypothetical protein A1F99_084400 [Pyrenophora tritici-repentis]|nr:hypothetical protein A1F99_084400 [Pyrenophora tritici-repentis]KAI1544220.1 hypothetical protein PtrSN001A_002754 [Pyrenophora tritici-repentis]KAI1572829.1 hypothetical protein PtrEW13061_011229 [Pyrenophora tritici-repentis]